MLTTLRDWLRQRDDLRIIGPDDPKLLTPTVSIVPTDRSIDQVFAALTDRKLMAGQEHFYGVRQLMDIKISIETWVLRQSFLHYTTAEEIDQLIEGLSVALR